MEYVVFPMKDSTVKVAILLDYIVAIWSSEDGTSAYLGMNFDPQEAIEVDTPLEGVMAYFDHYTETTKGDKDNGNIRDNLAGSTGGTRSGLSVRLVETESSGC